jgi:thiol-disulfide isomerase/thioredoxin
MKRTFIIVFFSIFFQNSFAQSGGTVFFEGNWSQVLAKAKKENKPIYVDFFTEWCGPCKMMDKQFFPEKSVGDILNNDFIAYHIDAEKGEGLELAKKYQITGYPSSVFITYEGIAYHRLVGFPGLQRGIEEIKKAEMMYYATASKRMEELDAEFNKGERSYEFVNAYLKRKTATGGDLNEIKDQYLASLNETDKLNPNNLKMLLASPTKINSKLYQFISKQIEADALKLPAETQNALNLGIEMANINAIMNNDYDLLKAANAANSKVNDFLIQFLKQRNISADEISKMNETTEDVNLERTLSFLEKTNRFNSLDSLIIIKSIELNKQKASLKSKDDQYYADFQAKSSTISGEQKNSDYYKNFENQQKQFYTKKMSEKYLQFAQHYLFFKKDKKAIANAIKFLNTAISLNETDTKLRALSEAYLIQGNKKKAMETINKAIELNPESLDLQLFQLKIEE